MTAIQQTSTLPRRAAERVFDGFSSWLRAFAAVTGRAGCRFAQRDWAGMQHDARERLQLYTQVVDDLLAGLEAQLGGRLRDECLWAAMRTAYAERIGGHPAVELGETFFNSVTRRVFTTVGVNAGVEFVDFRFGRVPILPNAPPLRTHVRHDDSADTVRRLLAERDLGVPWAALERDARRVARVIEEQWTRAGAPLAFEEIETLEPVFFRRKGAYIVGRVRGGERVMPLVLAVVHRDGGLVVDAALATEEDVSIVFSFTRSYFHVETQRPGDVIAFLRSLLPQKPVGELYTALGHHKHGKTEFWRDLQRHLARTDERFHAAPGVPGTVMAVFGMPSLGVVFKVIRDAMPAAKRVTRDAVKRRYQFVFAHDRAGRLVDAQEFEHVTLDRERFAEPLLGELLETAGRSVRLVGDQVILEHVYTERRVRPLDLYLQGADPARARDAVLDYGRAIRDLAATNVFPGDLLLKNFGVTRHGRVVFYDYDELCTLEECRFRDLPAARDPDDELAGDPWFGVGPSDVFPEELADWMPFQGAARDAFLAEHAGLFTAAFWRDLQARAGAGELVDVFPYRDEIRL